VIAGFVVDPKVWFMAAGIYALFIAYFIFHSRHRLVQGTPEEEFESIRKAEQDL
jgi:ethanolamine permease